MKQESKLKDWSWWAARRPIPAAMYPFLSPIKLGMDLSAWTLAIAAASWVRLQMASTTIPIGALARAVGFAWVAQIAVGTLAGLYRGRRRYGSFEEVALLFKVTVAATLVTFALERPFNPRTPMSALLVGGSMALVLMMGCRYTWRVVQEIRRRPEPEEAVRLLVFGAGERGCGLIEDLVKDRGSYLPVGLIDDDPGKKRFSVRGVKVLGSVPDISRVAREYRATALLVAVSDVPPALMAKILAQAEECSPALQVKVLSPLGSLFGEKSKGSDIRDLSEEDLLGRRKVDTNLEDIAGYIWGKRVLVTGAGGSIGSELCRQLRRYNPERLVMLDRDESALHGVQLSIEGTALLDSPDLVLADLRDRDRIMTVFKEVQPHVVFHAAALKHLPLLEANPGEAVKSNVWGTQTVLDAAMASGVGTFVNISTDKAADPCSVLGYSKRVAERLTANAAQTALTGTYVSVRFGNVLGSRGSVLSTFRQQIIDGKAITVTHPDITRYFMLIHEAVQLTIQAGAIGEPGEVLVLDMGEPKNIAEMARTLIRRSGKDIPIIFTGLREGEKMHEDLLGADEIDVRPKHALITQAPVPPLPPDAVEWMNADGERQQLIFALRDLCTIPIEAATQQGTAGYD